MIFDINIILHDSKIIVFQNRDFLCEAFIPNLYQYLNESNRHEFIEFFYEHALFEPGTTETIMITFNKWKEKKGY